MTSASLGALNAPGTTREAAQSEPGKSGPHRLDARGWLLACSLAFALAPVFISQAFNLRFRPHYQFAPVLVAGACWLAWTRGKSLWNSGRTAPALSATLLVMGWLLLLAGVFLRSDFIKSVSALWILAGFAGAVGGRSLIRALTPAFVLLAIVIPLPLQLDADTIVGLQGVTARWSSWLLDVLAVPHVAAGHVIEIPGHRMLIEQECSGINSLWTTIVFVLFLGFWLKRPLWHTLLLTCGSFVIALVANVSRVTMSAWILSRHDIDLLSGWRHESLGLLLFVAVLLLALSLDQFLLFLAEAVVRPTISDVSQTSDQPQSVQPVSRSFSFSRWTVLGFSLAFALLGCVQIGAAMNQSRAVLVRPVLPEQLGAWRQIPLEAGATQHTYPRGLVSEVWNYRRGKLTAFVTFDGPFSTWHELTHCYETQGWRVNKRAVQNADSSAPFVEVRLEQPLKAHAILCFGMRKETGSWLSAQKSPGNVSERIRTRLAEVSAREPDSTIAQVQVFAQSLPPLSPEESQQLRELFTLVQRALDATPAATPERTP